MSRLYKAILLGLLVGIIGLIVSPFRFMQSFEENAGMGLLFKLRGGRPAPSDAVIVSIDKESSEHLSLPDNPDKWPRSLHARLTEKLAKAGARVIAFDIHFIEPRSPKDDYLFAGSLKKACNAVLCEPLKLKEVPLSGSDGDDTNHSIVQVVQPLDLFSRSAAATAPFTLPRIPFKVSQYWTFETEAGDSPTMPAIVLQLFSMQVYEDFVGLLDKASPEQAGRLPRDGDAAIKTRGVKELMKDIRGIFESDPLIAEKMLKEVESSTTLSGDEKKYRLVKALIEMYSGGNSRYINYYGPPGTVATIPYYQALQIDERAVGNKQIDLKGKAVFVGLSEVLLAERKDSFYTVFSKANGTFISGVEIMSTAFSNLLTDTPLKLAGPHSYILIILLWGVLTGIICLLSPVGVSALSLVGLSFFYLFAVLHQFKIYSVSYPVVVPLFLQAPLAFFGALAWNYIDTTKELKNVKNAFGHYLPNDVVNQLAKDVAYIQTGSKVIDGICLMTDAQQYTALSENMGPHELRGFMNRYYETMFKPVKEYGGVVSGVTGDAMLALWVAARSDSHLKNKACCAALDINHALRMFKQKASDTVKIKTRIGLHCGQIILGNIGALDHYQYTPMGDIVNTASRIEGLNKYLGTSLLASEEVINHLDGFLVRDVGKFRLKGKVKPIAAYELMDRADRADEKMKTACAIFAEGLSAFKRKSWNEARERFQRTVELLGGDGPSRFYLELVKDYEMNPPAEPWDGVIHMEKK
jgi:adenylate cyclase